MRDVIYDVAVSLDGYIAASGDDVSAFPMDGPHVADYHDRLASYETVIMGRATYEFGYAFGLSPGARAYPHMDHHIFSGSGSVPNDGDVTVVAKDWAAALKSLREVEGGPIYLCGGGRFAGFVASEGHLTHLVIKRAPVVLGAGVSLFQGLGRPLRLTAGTVQTYDSNMRLERYSVTGMG